MARALLVGCGCRGRELGGELLSRGWSVRGTSRREPGLAAIAGAGIEAVLADPAVPGTVFEHVADVAVIAWLPGSAEGEPEAVAALHGSRLASLLARLVDTPVRGFLYEAAGSVPADVHDEGAKLVLAAGRHWRMPVGVVRADPGDRAAWRGDVSEAMTSLLAAGAPTGWR